MVATTILVAVIDDHNLLRNKLCELLGLIGFEVVIQAENGRDALQKFETAERMPHVCLLDVNMPVMNGMETAVALSKKYPDLRILGCSINDDENSILGMVRNGAHGYIVKDGSLEELKKAINGIVETGHYFDKNASKIVLKHLRQ